jgi:hypothetical protein
MFKNIHKLPQNSLYELYKWKNNIKYTNPKSDVIEYVKPNIHKSLIVSRTKKYELLNTSLNTSLNASLHLPIKTLIENKIDTENLLYEKVCKYSIFSICIFSGFSYIYIIYNKIELLTSL